MTYNIYGGRGRTTDVEINAVTKVLNELKPDLVALQEVDRGTKRAGRKDIAMILGKNLGMHYMFGAAIPLQGGEYGDAILSRWPITPEAHLTLPSSPNREKRSLIAGRVEIPDRQGGALWFGSTHFDHMDGDADRLLQAKAVLEAIQQTQLSAVVAGDFNCEPDSPPFRILSGRLLDTRKDHRPPSYDSVHPKTNIDGVLASPQTAWKVIETKTGAEIRANDPEWGELLKIASDHLPVLVVLERMTDSKKSEAPLAGEKSGLPNGISDGVADPVQHAR